MPECYQELLKLDSDDEININKIILPLARVPDEKNPHALIKLRCCSRGQIFKYVLHYPEIKRLCELPAMESYWLEKLKINGDFTALKLSSQELLKQYMGYYLFYKYHNYAKEYGSSNLAAEELLDKACEYNIFPALMRRCDLARLMLRNSNNLGEKNLDICLEYANKLSAFCTTPGYLEATLLYIEIGFYLRNKPWNFTIIDSRLAYKQALYSLSMAEEMLRDPFADVFIHIAYGKNGLQDANAMPEGLKFTSLSELKIQLVKSYNLDFEHLKWANTQAIQAAQNILGTAKTFQEKREELSPII